jgi:hypothetical protein
VEAQDSNWKGALAEAGVIHAATALGFTVLKPLSDGRRYDLILDTGARLVRAQCKWATLKSDVVVVRIRTSRLTPTGYLRTTYDDTEVDGIAAYCHDLGRCYWLPIADFAGQGFVHLRLRPARNNQRQLVKWAAQYEFGAIAQLGERVTGSHEVAGSSPASSTPAKPLF